MHLPTWDELLEEQKDVLGTPLNQSLFVVGPPGSGKTILAVERARSSAEFEQRVVVVTYNRMLRRLVTLLDGPAADTMQVFVGRDYYRRTRSYPPTFVHDSYAYNWTEILEHLDCHENAEYTCDHLVIDEGQDLAPDFFRYAERHIAAVLTVFADDDQALGDRHTSVEEILAATKLPDPIILSVNHRNRPEIAVVAEHFHAGRLPAAMVKRPSSGDRPRLIEGSSIKSTCDRIATWFQNRGGTIGVVVDRNATASDVHKRLLTLLPSERVDLYTNKLRNEDTIALLDPGITVLNQESVKGQEFDTLFLLELERFLPCTTAQGKRVMYMLCARARDYLFMISGQPLSPAANACLPPKEALERS